MKKQLCCLFMMIVLVVSYVPVTCAAGEAFIDNPNWIETSSAVVDEKYAAGETFVVMYYRTTCFNSNLRKTIINEIMSDYDVKIYGIDIDEMGNAMGRWVWNKLGANSVTLPVVGVVKNSTEYAVFDANDNMRTIQSSICELTGVYSSEIIDFYEINADIMSTYRKDKNYVLSFIKDEDDIDYRIIIEANKAVDGLTDDYEKLKAIHDWVSNNIYYDYVLLNTGVGATTAIDTYIRKRSVCQGYANLTAEMCQAVGIPCRVVTGFATGVGSDDNATDVWRACQTYSGLKDVDRLMSTISTYRNHAWNEAFVDGRWVMLDTTWDSNNDAYETGLISGASRDDYFDPEWIDFSSTHLTFATYYTMMDYQTTISGYRQTDDGCVVCVYAGNNTSLEVSGRVYAAVYDENGRLKACGVKSIDMSAESEVNVNVPVSCEIIDSDEIRVFMWSHATPLTM